ncbi:MAG: DUF362 domain-containing protein [Nanoarchaeota archaeon]|nr:DUF362 domain-containing protein [Nanoarchaeota archaeon]
MVADVFFSEDENKFLKELNLKLKNYFNGSIAIKLHMGEEGNKYFLKPDFVIKIIEILKENNLKPFLFDSPVVYPSPRVSAKGYLEVCKKHGFSEDKIGCPVIISDDFIEQEIDVNGKLIKFQVCKPLVDADGVLVLSHVKGHPCSGFGAGIKNLGMGALSKESKGMIHDGGKPVYDSGCTLCNLCSQNCPLDNIRYDKKRPFFDKTWCCGCSNCVVVCPEKAIKPKLALFNDLLAAGALAALKNFKKSFFVNVVKDLSKFCDCQANSGPLVAPDIGYLISQDLTAIDKSTHDFIIEKTKKNIFKEIHHVSPFPHIESFAKLSNTSLDYNLVRI